MISTRRYSNEILRRASSYVDHRPMQQSQATRNVDDETGAANSQISTSRRLYIIGPWLDSFDSDKVEFCSVVLGISGLSFIVLAVCILIVIYTAYERHLTSTIACTIINVTHTRVKLCPSRRCRIFNYCIPYVCTIVVVRYDFNGVSHEAQLLPFNIGFHPASDSCSYEPSSCNSPSRIQFDQITFLQHFGFVTSKPSTCCLDSSSQQPVACHPRPIQHLLSLILIIIFLLLGLVLLAGGIITQFHLMHCLTRRPHRDTQQDLLDTILDFRFSTESIRSIENTPVNYEMITRTLSQHPSPNYNSPKIQTSNDVHLENSLLFDVNEEMKIFHKERLRVNHEEQMQNEILRQYQAGNEQIKSILNKIESDRVRQSDTRLPGEELQRISFLLGKLDNLDVYFPTISKQLSIVSFDRISNSIPVDNRSSPISASLHRHAILR